MKQGSGAGSASAAHLWKPELASAGVAFGEKHAATFENCTDNRTACGSRIDGRLFEAERDIAAAGIAQRIGIAGSEAANCAE